jgi:putative Holliday junction resolvase
MDDSYIIGLDFGTRRIGVAVGQTITKTATPLEPIFANDGVISDWRIIQNLIEKWHPQALVVGLPLNMDGTPQPMTQRARLFIKTLKAQTNLPVYAMDERLTSVEARSRLFAEGGYRALQKHSIDSFAAKLILEDWFLHGGREAF